MLRFKRAGLIGAAVAFFCGLILHGAFGEFGLQALEGGWLSAEAIEAGRITAANFIRGEGRLVNSI